MKLTAVVLLFWFSLSAAEPHICRVDIRCLDGVTRILAVYEPSQYKQGTPAPLFFWLHGGVNRPEKDRGPGAVGFFIPEAKKAGIICAAPSGERGATWFDAVGYNNIEQSYRYMVTHYSIDTSQIYFGGSSDGATACYFISMKNFVPKIKGFVICSGFPGVLEQIGVPFDTRYLTRYSWYIIHAGKDHLYPLDKVRTYVNTMKAAGTRLVFKEYPDLPHGLDYADKEKPLILKWMGLKK